MIYFDACATGGKKADCVKTALLSHFDFLANPGRSGHALSVKNGMIASEFREEIASAFHLEHPERVIFAKNCSEALNLGILGSLQGLKTRGKIPHVVTTALEHNSVLRPLFYLQNRGKITLSVVSPNSEGVVTSQSIWEKINKNTHLVCATLVSNVTGCGVEVEKLAITLKNTDILLLCDGAQGLGHINFDGSCVDILCAPFHKALGGISGLGFCYFSKKATPKPILFGGTGTNSHSVLQSEDFPESFEVGTLNMAGIVASKAGFSHKMQNLEASQNHIEELTRHLESFKFENIKIFSGKNQCGIFSFLLGNLDSATLANIFAEKYNIACRGGLTCAPLCHKHLGTTKTGVLRISFDEYNTHEEIETLAKAIFEIAKM